ncbi:hypothetical protein J3459_017494 [Metarhizium acridum]|nr:hypothetical protein J3459_017494 [Metarhizium acridum]
MPAISGNTRATLNVAHSRPLMYQPAACLMTHGTVGPVNDDQSSQQGAPWALIEDQDFISKVDLIASAEMHQTIEESILQRKPQPCFYRTTISLGQLLDSEQFIQLIRNQEITMFCEANSTSASSYAIRNGILTIHMDKETFQRAGIPGKPLIARAGSDGQPKWGISVDLNSRASSPDGRIPVCLEHACSTVFTERLVWLLCLKTGSGKITPSSATY